MSPAGRHLRDRWGRRRHLQHLHRRRGGDRGRGPARRQARQPGRVERLRQRGPARGVGRGDRAAAAAVARCVEELGIGFLYASSFHPAMRHVAAVRAQLGIRTAFNVLGPLSNPAGAPHQVVGVSDPRLAPVMADALARLGKRHALVFRGDDGLDELTTTGPSHVWEVRDGQVAAWVLDPADLGIERAGLEDLRGGGVARERRSPTRSWRGSQVRQPTSSRSTPPRRCTPPTPSPTSRAGWSGRARCSPAAPPVTSATAG
jgi:hypothetical protein